MDGIDPLYSSYLNGCIPTAASTTGHCQFPSVTFQHIKDGSYPIWSIQRLVTTCNPATAGCQQNEALALTAAAQKSVGSSLPDFVPATSTNLHVFRSHFLPLTPVSLRGNLTVSNGNCGTAESGGDVGGVVYNTQSDIDYCSDFAVTNGITNVNRNGSAKYNGQPGQRQ